MGALVSCFHAGDSFVEVRGGLLSHTETHESRKLAKSPTQNVLFVAII